MGAKLPYKDGEFLFLSATELIARVAANDPTLAVISAASATELIRVGWSQNPNVALLYSLTSAGVWVSNRDSAGRNLVAEQNSAALLNTDVLTTYNTFRDMLGNYSTSAAEILQRRRRIGRLSLTTDAAGNVAATELVAALAGYYGVAKLLAVHGGDGVTLSLTFAVTGGTIYGKAVVNQAVTESTLHELPRKVISTTHIAAATDDNKAITVAVSGGGNVKTHELVYEYWYET